MPLIELFTDGACSGNPGPGGWCAILRCGNLEREISGGDKKTTNNRMELLAVINGLSAVRKECAVRVITDSKYVTDAFNQGWFYEWKHNGWRKSKGKFLPNADLWEHMSRLVSLHDVTFQWVRGHNEHPENERCDAVASRIAQNGGVCDENCC